MKLFLIGFMGCGKSTLGQQLSKHLALPFFDLDNVIEKEEKCTINEIFTNKGEDEFRKLEKFHLEKIIHQHDKFVLATGGGTPCFMNNIELMNRSGLTIWIHKTINTLVNRLQDEMMKRPLIKDLGQEDLKSYIIKKYSDRKIYYELAHIRIEESGNLIKIIDEALLDVSQNN